MQIYAFALALILLAPVAVAQDDLFIYGRDGQSAAQQEQDVAACRGWATDQTGFDPVQAELDMLRAQQAAGAQPAPQSSDGTEGARLRGAARGAATGAVIGAIAGDAGKGAAIGAAAGTMRGGAARRQARRAAQAEEESRAASVDQQQVSAQQTFDAGKAKFDRAFTACMDGKGYTVG